MARATQAQDAQISDTPRTARAAAQAREAQLAARVASRICHDLASPLGAVANGIELLDLSGVAGPEEMALIRQSADNAKARLELFRIAFGLGDAAQSVAGAKVARVFKTLSEGTRVAVSWHSSPEVERPTARLAILLAFCLEDALPHGGTVKVAESGDTWMLVAEGRELCPDMEQWEAVADGRAVQTGADGVHVTLVPAASAEAGRSIDVSRSAARLVVRF